MIYLLELQLHPYESELIITAIKEHYNDVAIISVFFPNASLEMAQCVISEMMIVYWPMGNTTCVYVVQYRVV